MKLTADDLRAVADTVDKIGAAGLDVEVVTVRGHRVLLKWHDTQMEGLQYYVIGITDGQVSGELGKVMREADADVRRPDTGHLPGRTPLGRSRR